MREHHTLPIILICLAAVLVCESRSPARPTAVPVIVPRLDPEGFPLPAEAIRRLGSALATPSARDLLARWASGGYAGSLTAEAAASVSRQGRAGR